MSKVTFKINDQSVTAEEGTTILFAALDAGIYIPHLCADHAVSDLKDVVLDECVFQGVKEFIGEHAGLTVQEAEAKGCGLCKVHLGGKDDAISSCRIPVSEGMVVTTTGDDLKNLRQKALNRIMADHPHACLLCEQREGCSRTDCSMNVPVPERCCILLGHCEIGKVADYVGYAADMLAYKVPEETIILEDPLFIRDYSLCIGCLRCVRACHEIAGADVLGAVLKNDKFVVGTIKPGDMPEAECRFCGACIEICPTGALRDREGVETPAAGAQLPCNNACPGGIDIPQYVRKIAEGDLAAARKIISQSVPLPATLGYVCFHPCEDHCRRSHLDQPVAICDLKRYAFESDDYPGIPERAPDTGKVVAIIGAGPAGISAAWMLAIKGHKVILSDAADKPGGFLRQVIPRFRLPVSVLEKDLSFLEKLGIEFQGGMVLGDNLDPYTLREFGHDAVLLAMGTPLSKRIDVEGVNLDGVLWGVDFLRAAVSDQPLHVKGKVVVVGGGSVAVDIAMTALRLNAESVEIVSLESEDELPATSDEIKQAKDEGIIFTTGWGPSRFISGNGRISKAEFKKCSRVFDDHGYFAPQFAEGNRIEREADWVILAIGQVTDENAFGVEAGKALSNHGLLSPDSESVDAWLPGFFGAGDLVHGPSSVIEAIASGKRAAMAIDKFLGGDGIFEVGEEEIHGFDAKDVHLTDRNEAVEADPIDRTCGMDLIRSTLSPIEAAAEANRCLRCNIRHRIKPPILPPEEWFKLTRDEVDQIPEVPGVCELINADGEVLRIKGEMNIRDLLNEWLDELDEGELKKFRWQEDQMYTQRESELIQQHIRKHGEMPGADDELDDLF
ncbi:MAG: FAD-dependent oxidoreductase [Candidatus Electryonea clarkiae]|nr:FAD-dependent oxidoreductase [Candidatus Electryonea clarkiae]MDP8287606.1 FAD-dependent oxidoreductase [Candidatus Electryonea clarkiae]